MNKASSFIVHMATKNLPMALTLTREEAEAIKERFDAWYKGSFHDGFVRDEEFSGVSMNADRRVEWEEWKAS